MIVLGLHIEKLDQEKPTDKKPSSDETPLKEEEIDSDLSPQNFSRRLSAQISLVRFSSSTPPKEMLQKISFFKRRFLGKGKENSLRIDLLQTWEWDPREPSFSLAEKLAPFLGRQDLLLVTGLETSQIFIRHLSCKGLSRATLRKTLPFQVEPLLPYAIEEALVFPQDLVEKEELLFFATKKASLQEHIDKIKGLDKTPSSENLDPDSISCVPSALSRFARVFLSAYPELCLYHLGKEKSVCLLLKKGELYRCYEVPIGKAHFCAALEKTGDQKVTLLSLDKSPDQKHLLQELEHALTRILLFFQSSFSQENALAFFTTGEIEIFPELTSWLATLFSTIGLSSCIKAELSLSFLGSPLPEEKLREYAIPLGLSLDVLYEDKKTLQLRQGVFLSKKRRQKKIHSMLSYLFSVFLLTVTSFTASHLLLRKKEAFLVEKISSGKSSLSLSSFLKEEEKRARAPHTVYPFIPSVPSVSAAFAWLSGHPQLQSGKSSQEKITVRRFTYELLQYPSFKQKKAPKTGNEFYKARVTLEIKTPSPSLARAFHDALEQEKEFVDTAQKITWKVQKGSYEASFFLKKGDYS